MSNLTSLKALLTALGGTSANSDTNDETIAKIADAVSNGGGSGAGVLIVERDEDDTLNKTYQEIFDALPMAYLAEIDETGKSFHWIAGAFVDEDVYTIDIDGQYYGTDSADGYPARQDTGAE